VNFQASREFPDAWQGLTRLHFLRRDQEDNLFCELLPNGYFAPLINQDVHVFRTTKAQAVGKLYRSLKCDSCETVTEGVAAKFAWSYGLAQGKQMRYDIMFWVLIAPALASCACFALEHSGFGQSHGV